MRRIYPALVQHLKHFHIEESSIKRHGMAANSLKWKLKQNIAARRLEVLSILTIILVEG